jgi:hypothetical protein
MNTTIISFKTNDLSNINDETILNHKKYKNINELKNTKITSCIPTISKMSESITRDYLDNWIYTTYYNKRKMNGCLTKRIENIDNNICYRHIMKLCFNSVDIISMCSSKQILLENNTINFIQELHSICSSSTGTFIDYLIRRIISELTNKIFIDNRAEKIINKENDIIEISHIENNDEIWEFDGKNDYLQWKIFSKKNIKSKVVDTLNNKDKFIVIYKINEWLYIKHKNKFGFVRYKIPDSHNFVNEIGTNETMIINKYISKCNNENIHICSCGCKYNMIYFNGETCKFCNFSLCQNMCYEKTKNIQNYETKQIIKEIFITSLVHAECFGRVPDQKKTDKILEKLELNNLDKIFIDPLIELCKKIIKDKTNILLNPTLGDKIKELNNIVIPSDADLIIDDILIDIKCTKKSNKFNEILQLLGYSGLVLLNDNYNIKINNIGILNILNGTYHLYNINYLQKDNFIKYVKLLI